MVFKGYGDDHVGGAALHVIDIALINFGLVKSAPASYELRA